MLSLPFDQRAEIGASAAHDYGIGSWPQRQARIRPSDIAVRQHGYTLTYAEFAYRVDRVATTLAELGVGRADRVAYLGYNTVAAFELLFATCRLGALFVPLNTRLSASEIGALLDDCAPAALFHGPDQATTIARLEPAQRPETTLRLDDDNRFHVFGGDSVNASGVTTLNASVELDDDAVILYTSGTTGRAKGVVLTHANLTFNAMNQLAHVDVLSTDIALCFAPLFHATGLSMVTLPTLFKGGTVVLAPRFDAASVLSMIAEHRVTSFAAVPTMLQMLCEHSDFTSADLDSLRYVIYGGSPAAEYIVRCWRQRGVELLQGYGMTEASPGVSLADADTRDGFSLSAGTPHFFTDIALDSAVAPVPDGHTGELLVRGLNVSRGYWNRTADPRTATGWFRTGDVVRLSPEGRVFVVDRIKDMIISGGENIFPAEIEAVAKSFTGIADCAVIGVPDQRWGEVGAAYIVPTDRDLWTVDQLRAALRENIAAYKVPRHIVLTDGLPRNATGKVDKRLLQERFSSESVRL